MITANTFPHSVTSYQFGTHYLSIRLSTWFLPPPCPSKKCFLVWCQSWCEFQWEDRIPNTRREQKAGQNWKDIHQVGLLFYDLLSHSLEGATLGQIIHKRAALTWMAINQYLLFIYLSMPINHIVLWRYLSITWEEGKDREIFLGCPEKVAFIFHSSQFLLLILCLRITVFNLANVCDKMCLCSNKIANS